MSVFGLDTPVLRFGPRLPKGMSSSEPRNVMWPALVYRVVAPEVSKRQLNILEKAVFGLCRAGVTDLDRIGSRLHIDRDLAAEIIRQLQDRGVLASGGLPTEAGRTMFEDEVYGATELVTGFVFQDPWSGALWPRFMERLAYANIEQGDGQFPDLVLGSAGSPKRYRAFWHLPRLEALPPAPTPAEVLEASMRHRRVLRHGGMDEEESAFDDNIDGDFGFGGPRLERVSVVDQHPTAVMLASYVFMPEGDFASRDWLACDPFRLGVSNAWRAAIVREMDATPLLREYIGRLVERSGGPQPEDMQRLADEVHSQAAFDLDALLTIGARDLPQYDDLLALQVGRIEAGLLADAYPQHRLRDLYAAARRALEGTLAAVATQHPLGQVWRRLYGDDGPIRDTAYCRLLYEESARDLGFTVPLPRPLAGVLPNHVKAVCYGSAWRLRPAVVASLLAARDDAGHPFRRVAPSDPGLLAELDELAAACGDAVHAGGDQLTIGEAQGVADAVLRVVGLLTGLVPAPAPGAME